MDESKIMKDENLTVQNEAQLEPEQGSHLENNIDDMAESDVNAVNAENEEVKPLIDFKKADEKPDTYEDQSKSVKNYLANQFQLKLLQLFIGIIFFILTTRTGILGTFLFTAALFYLVPDGLVKSIAYFYRYRHYRDYVESNDARITENFWKIVMNAMREKGVF